MNCLPNPPRLSPGHRRRRIRNRSLRRHHRQAVEQEVLRRKQLEGELQRRFGLSGLDEKAARGQAFVARLEHRLARRQAFIDRMEAKFAEKCA